MSVINNPMADIKTLALNLAKMAGRKTPKKRMPLGTPEENRGFNTRSSHADPPHFGARDRERMKKNNGLFDIMPG